MRAYVSQCEVGTWKIKLGSSAITPEYVSLANLERYYLPRLKRMSNPSNRWIIQCYRTWDDRYKEPDYTIYLEYLLGHLHRMKSVPSYSTNPGPPTC